ncbi:hypothetical protein HYH03_003930 [Edaphochlamys debaryana]|uniref:Protein kinase domain-containing protein n=1 Tax=Edaphochlamys debaryana TaxID=47281 RepID=A0A836C2W2_9CHLO|nr:hypothetical protein HYH03_003930 [Edaphochlamys debaryana]|eukprot:KAG2498175.1 hypothetical protein HYH03_003930 [Edaphochlamys debaryana]
MPCGTRSSSAGTANGRKIHPPLACSLLLAFLAPGLLLQRACAQPAEQGPPPRRPDPAPLTYAALSDSRTAVTAGTGAVIAAALADPLVQVIVLINDVVLEESDWAAFALPVRMGRNVTLLGARSDTRDWLVLDCRYQANKVLIAPGVAFSVQYVVIRNGRWSPHFVFPGWDLIAPQPLPGPGEPWPCVLMNQSAIHQRTSLPSSIASRSTLTVPRPSQIPGQQVVMLFNTDPACTEDLWAPPMQRCWPKLFSYTNVASYGYHPDEFQRAQPSGYVFWFLDVIALPDTLMTDECVAQLGALGCWKRMFPKITFTNSSYLTPPAPPPSSTAPPPPALDGSADLGRRGGGSGGASVASAEGGDGGGGGDVPLGAILGGTLGGAALLAALLAAAVLVLRRQQPDGATGEGVGGSFGGGSKGGSVTLAMDAGPAGNAARSGSNGRGGKVPTDRQLAQSDSSTAAPPAAVSTQLPTSEAAAEQAQVPLSADTHAGAGPMGSSHHTLLSTDMSHLPVTPLTPPAAIPKGVRLGGEVQLLGVTRGKGAHARVVEGMYDGRLVAVKLLDRGLLVEPSSAGGGTPATSVAAEGTPAAAAAPETGASAAAASPAAAVPKPAAGAAAVPAATPAAATAAAVAAAAVPAAAAPPAAAAAAAAGAQSGEVPPGLAPPRQVQPSAEPEPVRGVAVSLGRLLVPPRGDTPPRNPLVCGDAVAVGPRQLLVSKLRRSSIGSWASSLASSVFKSNKNLNPRSASPAPAGSGSIPAGAAGTLAPAGGDHRDGTGNAYESGCAKHAVDLGHCHAANPREVCAAAAAAAAGDEGATSGRMEKCTAVCNITGPEQDATPRAPLATPYSHGAQGGELEQSKPGQNGADGSGNAQGPSAAAEGATAPGAGAAAAGRAGAGGSAGAVASRLVTSEANGVMKALAQEVEVLARLQHPNIVQLLAANLGPPRPLLVMELMDTSLDRLLYGKDSQAELLPLSKVLHIALHIAQALDYLHPFILHRARADLKPANVLLSNPGSPTPVVKLGDFGLSRLQGSALITAHVDVGTAPYMAPETLDTRNCVLTHHVDLYAYGILVW